MKRLVKFLRCGHIGRTNNSPRAKHQAFIRVAEIRGYQVDDVPKSCPVCTGNCR